MEASRNRVVEHYAQVACCCAPESSGEAFELYAKEVLEGLPKGTLAASRGCGDPVAKANLQPGETVLDLGSGGGIDALIASRLVGAEGRVFGIDMTPEMVALARKNAAEAGAGNVEFLEGSIDAVSLPDASVDVVVSNCVINFCEDKRAVFAEARRVLRPGGRMVVSDIVAFAPVPPASDEALRAISGCTNGITSAEDYRAMLGDCGFADAGIEVKTLYTDEELERRALRKGRGEAWECVRRNGGGGCVGSAIVRARLA